MPTDYERKPRPDPTREQLQSLLRYLPLFEDPKFKFGEWVSPQMREDGTLGVGYYVFSDQATQFMTTFRENKILLPFDWPAWSRRAVEYASDPDRVAKANLLTLRKLLTTHIRGERFFEGHLETIFECGHLTAILRRLEVLVGPVPLTEEEEHQSE